VIRTILVFEDDVTREQKAGIEGLERLCFSDVDPPRKAKNVSVQRVLPE
jgi:hypothetical protein